MKTSRLLIVTVSLIFALACSVSMGGEPTPVPPAVVIPPAQVPLPTYTPFPTYTVVAPPPVQPTIVVVPPTAPVTLPQEWTGLYNQTSVGKVGISLLIERINGNSFTGRMLWLPTKWYNLTITKMNGEYIQDFGDTFEQGRWSKHPDFNPNAISDGTWLKWTETEMISGNSTFTMNGWYYAHIQSNGKMVGIYYFNATETKPAADSYELKLKP